MQYHLVTLGCQMNKSDSERIAAVVEAMGYRRTEDEDQADLIGIVACSVRQKAIDRVYSKIHKWNQLKQSRPLVTFVTGCMLPADREKFLKLFDLTFQTAELPQLPAMLRQYGVVTPYSLAPAGPEESAEAPDGEAAPSPVMRRPEQAIGGFWDIRPHYGSDIEAYIPIQNGCDKFCTFCAVPYTRGREVSRPADEILIEVRRLVESGCRSITLLGQNVNSYGRDKPDEGCSFTSLLDSIGRYGDSCGRDFRVYFTSPHPRDMTDDVLEAVARYRCLARQIHLPVQSGDDKVLIRMNRKHSVAAYRRIIASIRRLLPEATLFTDIIVGFSGETDAQFERTAALMEEVRFNMAYIACYSPRPGAASARWEDDVPHAVKKARMHRLSELLQQHARAHNARAVGRRLPVLVTGPAPRKDGWLSGSTEGRIAVRFPSDDTGLVGRFAEVEITAASDFALEGVCHGALPEGFLA